jgi:hypothetical protein
MVRRTDYGAVAVEAAHSVLLEVMHVLGEYSKDIVLIGGWVPVFLVPQEGQPHVGSMDVDLAVNHTRIGEAGYRTIEELLVRQGYRRGREPHAFRRTVVVGGRAVDVEVDLLAGEYAGVGKSRRHQRVQGVLARKARGCDLAFDLPREVAVEGELPDGRKDTVAFQVASVVAFLVMKGMALDARLKEKDAYDIWYCLRNYPGGIDALSSEFAPHLHHGLVREGLARIARHFASETHVGPVSVANFEEVTDPEERALLQRDAYERVAYLLGSLNIR